MKKQFLLAAILFVSGTILLSSCKEEEPVDITAPVITLKGDANITLDFGASFSDPGTTATDDTDGDLTSKVTVTGAVNTSSAETISLKYNVSDAASNKAAEVSRTVNVVLKNTNMVGAYSCTNQVGSASPSTPYDDNVAIGSGVNSIKFPKFAKYSSINAELKAILKGTNGTVLEIPEQTVSVPGAIKTFTGSGTISKNGKVITINYTEKQNNPAGPTVTGTCIYTRQ
jgi:hypothetical protein